MHWGLKLTVVLVVLIGAPVGLYYWNQRAASGDHLTLAKDAIERRDFPTALRELDLFLTQMPKHTEARLLAAQTARRAGQFDRADQHLRVFRDLGGSREEADLELELRASQTGAKVDNAVQVLAFCRANPNNPATGAMLEALAQGLLARPNPPLAIQCLDLWLARSLSAADQAQGHVWRGQALDMQGLAPEAAVDYRQALTLAPSHSEARLRLAQFLTRDNPSEARAILEQLLTEAPDRAEVRLHLARCYRLLGELAKAAQYLETLRVEVPDDLNVLIEAGALAIDQGNPAAAEPLLRQAVILAPQRRDPNMELLRCLRALRKDDEAKKQQAKVQEIDDEIQRKIDLFNKKK
jgi:Tfp pilus assembly protein PilF